MHNVKCYVVCSCYTRSGMYYWACGLAGQAMPSSTFKQKTCCNYDKTAAQLCTVSNNRVIERVCGNIFPLFIEATCTCVQVHEILIHTIGGKVYIIILMSQFTIFLPTQLYFIGKVSQLNYLPFWHSDSVGINDLQVRQLYKVEYYPNTESQTMLHGINWWCV